MPRLGALRSRCCRGDDRRRRWLARDRRRLGTRDAGAQRVIVQPLGSEALEGVGQLRAERPLVLA